MKKRKRGRSIRNNLVNALWVELEYLLNDDEISK